MAYSSPEAHLPVLYVACERGEHMCAMFTFTDQHIGAAGSRLVS